MAHVVEHLPRGRLDVDLLAGDAERAHQRPGIALGRLAGGEAGHGEAEDRRARQAEIVAGLGGDDQGMGGIETARDADDQMRAAGRLEAAGEALHLDVERLVAILVELLRPVRDIRESGAAAARSRCPSSAGWCAKSMRRKRFSGWPARRGIVVEGAVAHPLQPQPLHVDVGDGELRLPFEAAGLGEQFAQLVDRALPVPGEVGGALARPGGGEDIGGVAAAGLAAQSNLRSSALPIVMLEAERLVRISAPASAPMRRGRLRRPDNPRRSRRGRRSRQGRRRRRSGRCRTATFCPASVDLQPLQRRRRRRTSASHNIRGNWAG